MNIPDTTPGAYYVTAIYNGRHALLAGPFPNDQATALALVDRARVAAEKVDPRAIWYSYGTARYPEDFNEPGKLNRLIEEG